MADAGPLVGTPSKVTLTDAEGNVIVKEGEIITANVISAARDAGRFDELIMSGTMAFAETTDIRTAGKYVEIGQEDPLGIHPE